MSEQNRVKDFLDNYLEKKAFAGAGCIVRKDGVVVEKVCNGYADLEHKIPVTEQTMFRLASMTKPVVAIAVMILEEEGKINIDDEVSKYLPEFSKQKAADRVVGFMDCYEADPQNPLIPKFNEEKLDNIGLVDVKREVRIRDLLSHSSGMGQGPFSMLQMEPLFHNNQTLEERVSIIAKMPLDFQPGTMTGYSAAVGFEVLGRIVEVVSEMDLNSFIQEKICKPLKIKDLGFVLSEEQKGRIARLYEAADNELIDVTESDEPWKKVNPLVNGYFSGSAGMIASLESYDRIVQMLANGGVLDNHRILKIETVNKMSSLGSYEHLEMGPGVVWGLGMIVHENPQKENSLLSKGTFGWSGAYGTHFFVDPIKHITVTMVMAVSNIGGADSYIAKELEKVVGEAF